MATLADLLRQHPDWVQDPVTYAWRAPLPGEVQKANVVAGLVESGIVPTSKPYAPAAAGTEPYTRSMGINPLGTLPVSTGAVAYVPVDVDADGDGVTLEQARRIADDVIGDFGRPAGLLPTLSIAFDQPFIGGAGGQVRFAGSPVGKLSGIVFGTLPRIVIQNWPRRN